MGRARRGSDLSDRTQFFAVYNASRVVLRGGVCGQLEMRSTRCICCGKGRAGCSHFNPDLTAAPPIRSVDTSLAQRCTPSTRQPTRQPISRSQLAHTQRTAAHTPIPHRPRCLPGRLWRGPDRQARRHCCSPRCCEHLRQRLHHNPRGVPGGGP